MGHIEKVNQKIKEMVNEGYTPAQAIIELAQNAGIYNFNPYKATETQLRTIAMNI